MDTQSQRGEWQERLSAVPLKKEQLDQLVLDFIVTEGYSEAAQEFIEATQAESAQSHLSTV